MALRHRYFFFDIAYFAAFSPSPFCRRALKERFSLSCWLPLFIAAILFFMSFRRYFSLRYAVISPLFSLLTLTPLNPIKKAYSSAGMR